MNEKEWTLHESHVILSANHRTYWVSDDDDDEEEEDEDDDEEGHAAAADDDDGDGDGDDDDDDDGGAVDDVLGWRCNPMSECCYWY